MAERKSSFAGDVTIPVTVPQFIFDAVARQTSQDFALSYLFGAEVGVRVLTPRTMTAYQRLTESDGAMKAFREVDVTLSKPMPFGGPGGSTIQLDPVFGGVKGESASARQRMHAA